MDEYGWASAVGKLRVLEKSFLTKTDLGQLASSGSLESALGALRDTTYGPFVAKLPGEAFDLGLQEALLAQYRAMISLAPEPLVIVAFRARHDFHNLKVYAKSRRLGMALEEEALSHTGNLSLQELDRLCQDEPFEDSLAVAGPLAGALKTVYAETARFAEDTDNADAVKALKMDAWVDQAYFRWYHKVLKRFGYETLNRFVSYEIDVTNLRMFFRGRRQGIPGPIMEGVFLRGGSVSSDTLAQVFGEDLTSLASVYEDTRLRGLAMAGIEVLKSGASLTAWERECDDSLMDVVRQARSVPIGPEPAFGYVFGREIEARNLRVILSGKQSSVSSKEISERLREPYV